MVFGEVRRAMCRSSRINKWSTATQNVQLSVGMARKLGIFSGGFSREEKDSVFVFAGLDGGSRFALLGQEEATSAGRSAREPDYLRAKKGFYSFVSNAGSSVRRKENAGKKKLLPSNHRLRRFRSFWPGFVGHVADASYMFCSQGLRLKQTQRRDIKKKKTKTSKAALVGRA